MFDRDDDRECKVCDALIPENQTFCARHYQEALLRFEEESLKYERALDEWESMTPAERARRHAAHDQALLRRYAIILSVAVSITLGVTQHLGALETGVMTLVSALIVGLIRPLYILLGRVGRGLRGGVVYSLITLSVVSIMLWFAHHFPYQTEVLMGSGAACFIFSFWREGVGGHQVCARPIPPVRPSP